MSVIYQAGRERASAPEHENNDYKPACKIMRAKIAEFALKLPNERLRRTFLNCFYSTLDTAAEMLADGSAFMLTGDIPAMWLRDSAVQVMGYLPFANDDPDVARLVRGLLKRQFFYIGLDPYSNAFNREANGRGHKDDVTDWDSPWVWERKYEIDSLCYPLWLAQKYAGTTGDFTVYDEEFRAALRKIIDTFKTEQRHFEKSAYFHSRPKYPQFPTLQNGGRGNPVGYTGMTWNGYRPSDDVCEYGYLVPSNMFVTVVFDYLCKNAEKADVKDMRAEMETLVSEISEGIQTFAVVDSEFGKIYAYEVDGLGGVNLMDDANVPSLLSLPYLGYCTADDPVYKNTRRFVLSEKNPYYFKGKAAAGVGSPHTPEKYIWHIGVIMQLLTSADAEERRRCMETLLNTDAGCEVMHEGFHCDDPSRYTRPWFCWANTLFALAVTEMSGRGEL